jgi:hypothetical protein
MAGHHEVDALGGGIDGQILRLSWRWNDRPPRHTCAVSGKAPAQPVSTLPRMAVEKAANTKLDTVALRKGVNAKASSAA